MGSKVDFTAIILAAGCARRMGCPKQLLNVEGSCMLDHAIGAALDAGFPATVVLGAYRKEILGESRLIHRCNIVINDDYRSGMAGSLRCGTQAVAAPRLGYIFLLADQPRITAELVLRMSERFRRDNADILYPVYKGKRGNPVIIGATLRKRLLQASGDRGARFLFGDQTLKILKFPAADDSVLGDIDTPEDYRRLIGKSD